MKKYITTAVLITAISLTGIIAAALWINGQQDNVSIEEVSFRGSRAAAEGVQLTNSFSWSGKLNWTTSYDAADTSQPKTVFDLKPWGSLEVSSDCSLEVSTPFNTGLISENAGIHLKNSDPLGKVINDVASRTKPGKTHTETIKLKDYFQYYPLRIDIYTENYYSEDVNYISDRLKIPVQKDHTAEVTVRKDARDTIVEISCDSNSYLTVSNHMTKKGCYFTVNKMEYLPVKSSHEWKSINLPSEAQNIYYIPFTANQKMKGKICSNLKEMKKLYALEDGGRLVSMTASRDKKNFYLITAEHGSAYFSFVERKSMKLKQKIYLYNVPEHYLNFRNSIEQNDTLALFFYDGQYFLLSQKNDRFSMALKGKLPTITISNQNNYLPEITAIDYDGTKAAFAASTRVYNDAQQNSSDRTILYIFSSGGLEYMGEYNRYLINASQDIFADKALKVNLHH